MRCAQRTTWTCLLLLEVLSGCGERDAAPVEAAERAEPEVCPPNASVGGPCVRSTFCTPTPVPMDGPMWPVHPRYPECPGAQPLPEPGPAASVVAHFLAGTTCERRAGEPGTCCYEWLRFCAR